MQSERNNEAIVTGGFAAPVFDAQVGFRAIMDAMAMPGTIVRPTIAATPPQPMNAMAGLVALTLCDDDTPVWVEKNDTLSAWIAFHTGAAVVSDRSSAQFVFKADVTGAACLETLPMGTQEYPDRSATLVVQVDGFETDADWLIDGPGIKVQKPFRPIGLSDQFLRAWHNNQKEFPRGVDIIFASQTEIAALPRTTRIVQRSA